MKRSRTFLAPVVAVLGLGLLSVPLARAAEQLPGRPGEPALPPIPEVGDFELSAEERKAVLAGEIVVQTVRYGDEDRQARAIGYLKADPRSLFEISTDAELQMRMFEEYEEYEEYELWETGKRFRAVADASWLLPAFHYDMTAGFNPTRTAHCWTQIEGDFDKNHGSQSYLWDPHRQQTLAIFTFDLALRGILDLVPEAVILSLAKNNLRVVMRSIDEMVATVHAEDPARARAMDARWAELRARLDAGEAPGRVLSKGLPALAAPAERTR